MIQLGNIKIGDCVLFSNNYNSEYGIVTGFNSKGIYVRFATKKNSELIRPEFLTTTNILIDIYDINSLQELNKKLNN